MRQCLGCACQTCIHMKARTRFPSRTVHCNEMINVIHPLVVLMLWLTVVSLPSFISEFVKLKTTK